MKNKKSPWLGCLFYLLLVGPAFFFTSWQVATSIAVLVTALMFMYGAITREFKKMKKLKNTQRRVISNTPKYGYVKLVAKIKAAANSATTYFTKEAADFHWISFQYAYTVNTGNADGSSSTRTDWHTFYEKTTAMKTFEIYDSTGSCSVGLHNAHWYVNEKSKQMKARELLQFIQTHNISDVPLEEIEETKRIRIIERWVSKDQLINFYGTMNKLPLDEAPFELIEKAQKARKYGPDDDTRKTDRKRLLDETDWLDLIAKAKESGADTLDILTSDYSDTPENELVLNVKDNKILNRNSYIAIVMYLISAGIFCLVWYAFINSEYPEFLDFMR